MGEQIAPARMLANIPTFYITDTFQEDAGDGNVRIWNYAKVKGVLVPQFVCIVASRKLLTVTRKMRDLAQVVSDAELKRLPGDHVH